MVQSAVLADLEKAREEAQTICSLQGNSSPACAASWNVVEELQTALANHRENQTLESSFQEYCEENPESDECRIYDV